MHFNRKVVRNALLAFCVSLVILGVVTLMAILMWKNTGRHEENTGRDEENTGRDEDICKPGRQAACKMAALYPGFGRVPVPLFLDQTYKQFPNISEYVLPFGMRNQFEIVDGILTATENYALGGQETNRSCIVVGNGGILSNKSLGQDIDTYDVVVRLNRAPVKGYEKDVGTKTTMRILYPESCPEKTEELEDQSLFVLSAFKHADLEWFRDVVLGRPVAQHIERKPAYMRILNPHFIRELSFQLIGFPYNAGLPLWDRKTGNIPTTGAIAITMALHGCDRVAVAGFGYNLTDPDATLHYYDNLPMSEVTIHGNHNITKEKQFLRKIAEAEVIQDLTMGIIG